MNCFKQDLWLNLQKFVLECPVWHVVITTGAGVQPIVDETLEHIAGRPAMNVI